jgi:surfeit locus 1 family protein
MNRNRSNGRRVWVLLAALSGVVLTASLGQWQMRRAAQKQALVQARSDKAALAPVDGASLGVAGDSAANREGLLYRAVQLNGQWLPEHTVYLENRQMQSRPGFFVVTPLQLTGSQQVILVQRGWVPRSFTDRTALPPVQTPAGQVQLQGHLAPWPSRMYDFGAVEEGPIRQNLDFTAYRLQTGLPLLELSVQQSGAASEGLLREWPEVASGVEKHHGYAFQWFGLSALIALLYVWFQIVQPRRKSPRR